MRMTAASAWRFVRSARLALWLIGILAAFILIAFAIPQRTLLTADEYARWSASAPAIVGGVEAIGLDSVYTSWPFLATLTALALNLTACTITRWGRAPSYPPRVPDRDPPAAREIRWLQPPADPVSGRVSPGLGWRLTRQDADTWVFWRGRIGRLGSLVMHGGMLLLLAGGLLSSLTRFSGTLAVTESQVVTDSPENYYAIAESPRYGEAFTGATLGLESMRFEYSDGVVIDAVASMSATGRDGVARRADVRVNYPLRVDGKAYLLEKAGHAVAVRFTDPEGVVVASSVVNLGESGSDGSADTVVLGDATIRLRLISDRAFLGAADPAKFDLNDPVLYVDVITTDATGTVDLLPGSSGEAAGWTIDFADARLWNRFMVRSDGGRWISFVAFGLVIAGMGVRWWDPDAVIVVRRSAEGLRVWGRSRQGDVFLTRGIDSVRAGLARSPLPEEEVS